MNILSFIETFTNTFNEISKISFNPYDVENYIKNFGDNFTINLFIKYLEYLDLSFKNSEERKNKYYVKESKERTLLTSIGYITFKYTRYVDKETHKSYIFLRELLNIKPYQRLTEQAEYELIKYAKEENMSQAARHALRNTIVSRSIVSKKIQKLNGSIHEEITKSNSQPDVLYIEMDEIHANLQKGGNQICPCSIVHEGYEEEFVKRKKLKNIRSFASSNLSYEELWEVIFDYVDKKYDIDKFKAIFVSGDGATGIKNYKNCFPKALFVLDKFHYKRKHLAYIFKKDTLLIKYADEYLRNDKIDDFKLLVKYQIEKFPEQENKMKEHMNYILNNLEGIKNQTHPLYKCPCSMEGHVSNQYARYITSSPYGFSKQGLENKLKLLVLRANKHDLTFDEFLQLKYSSNEYEDIVKNINKTENIKRIKFKQENKISINDINVKIPLFDDNKFNNQLKELISERNIIKII